MLIFMLKRIGRIGFAILLVLLMILTIIFSFKTNKTTSDGHINVIVKNIDGEIISNERFEYNTDDSLYDLINDNYDLECTITQYGHYIVGINSIKTDIYNSWVWLELAYLKDDVSYSDDIDYNNYDCKDANVGIDNIVLVDNMILGIVERDSTHTTTIFSEGISVGKEHNYKIFRTIVYVLIAILIASLIVYGIIHNKISKDKITIRKMCIISLMAVILFVQEEALTILPNIQLTFLLISLFAAIFGIKYSLIIVSIHIILDNVVMGSFTPIVMIPMFIGYVILVIVMYLVKKENLLIKVIMASICSWIYCMLFLFANALWLDIDVKAYFIADIPFEILLILSTILTMTYLYRPLEKVIYREWNKNQIEEQIDQDE